MGPAITGFLQSESWFLHTDASCSIATYVRLSCTCIALLIYTDNQFFFNLPRFNLHFHFFKERKSLGLIIISTERKLMTLSALYNNINNIHVMCTGLSWFLIVIFFFFFRTKINRFISRTLIVFTRLMEIEGFITTGIELIGKISMKNYISSRRDTRFLESNMIHDFWRSKGIHAPGNTEQQVRERTGIISSLDKIRLAELVKFVYEKCIKDLVRGARSPWPITASALLDGYQPNVIGFKI